MAAQGKRVSWVELYFDLVFVLAVGQVAHVVADDPAWPGAATGDPVPFAVALAAARVILAAAQTAAS